MLRVGVIGCGGHAQGHFRMIGQEPRLRLTAIAELDPDRRARAQAEHHPEAAFDDYRRMLDAVELDVVHVVTMPGHLLPIVTETLGRGIHTSIEKSPGMTSAETRQMLAAERTSPARALVSFNRRYFPEVLAVRRRLQERGGAVQVAAIYHKTPFAHAGTKWTTLAPEPLICDAIHHVDLLRWLAGRTPEAAATVASVLGDAFSGAEDGTQRYNGLIRFDTGCRGVMMSHYGVGYRIQQAEAHAEGFSAYLDLTERPRVTLYEEGALRPDLLDLDAVGGSSFNEVVHFTDCILNGTAPWSNLEDAVHTMELAEAIAASRS
ncbi:MAG: Gfo/Idh/MocA family oxidoreductase [Armatimonadetes bacterium]|nr:Gfo/Idh/MocA family oxidoreductase [Armatimonadota bacterium]